MTCRRKPHRVAIVYWLDAYGEADHDPKIDGVLQISAGLLISRNRRRVQLAQIADVSGRAEVWRDVLTIPAGMVRGITILAAPPMPAEPAKPDRTARRGRKPPAPPEPVDPPPPGDEPC